MNRFSTLFTCIAILGFTFACSRPQPEPEPEPVETAGAETPPPAEDPQDVHMEGEDIVIDQMVHFGFDSAEILDDSTTILDHLATFINNHGADVPAIEVIGHTDRQGTAQHNLELSQSRAAAVVSALQERGVQITLTPIGRGHTEPVCQESTDECHERNRRVVFHVVR
jgi:OOP family OmpA-OmpF porin